MSQDDLYTIMPLFSILELLVVLLYLGHFSGCFFYLLSTPPYQTAGANSFTAPKPVRPGLPSRGFVAKLTGLFLPTLHVPTLH